MKLWVSESDKIKTQAGEEAVVMLDNWKKKSRRYRIYRYCLYSALVLCATALTSFVFYQIDSDIPSVIHVRAGQEQSFELDVPAKAEIVSVSEQGKSNIPEGAVTIDLSEPVTVRADSAEQYLMQVKLFGILPFKQVGIQPIENQELIPVGLPVGIYVKADGILVIGVGDFVGQDGSEHSPAKNIIKTGDYIHKLNGEPVTKKDDFIAKIEKCGGAEQILTVERDGETFDVRVIPVQDQTGAYKLGVWIRDSAQGVGTMTYVDKEGNFGALGHGINDVDTSTLMDMDDGTLYETEIVSIRKGTAGNPGEMTGLIVYSDDKILGDITENSSCGIFGNCDIEELDLSSVYSIPIGLKQEILIGAAQIICTVDGTPKYYDVKITDVHLDHDNVNRGIELTVTDPELLEKTGGIVQGMSGAPIIQNGKFIGAVTHVLVQDSTRGYGIFIENMLEH